MRRSFCIVIIAFISFSSHAQTDSTISVVNKKHLVIASTTIGVAYTGSMIALGEAWYKNSPRQPFHFFNDWHEWKQMDKGGHFFNTYHVVDNASAIFKSTGLSRKKSDIIGAITGMVIVSSIEVFDGYSAAYGASMSDIAANAAGTLFYLGQSWTWQEIRLHPKLSFHPTSLAKQRPDVLGSGLSEILKNYNGQTFWLSVDVGKFLPSSKWPKWLSVSGGYGAENMYYARDHQNEAIGLDPYRQYYLSVDVDWTAIPVRSKFLKAVLKVVNIVKVPAPTLEFSRKGVRGHVLYF